MPALQLPLKRSNVLAASGCFQTKRVQQQLVCADALLHSKALSMFGHAKRWQSAVGVSALCLVRWMEREYHHIEASKPADSDTGSKAKEVMDEASLPIYALAEVHPALRSVPCTSAPPCLLSPASHAGMLEIVVGALIAAMMWAALWLAGCANGASQSDITLIYEDARPS